MWFSIESQIDLESKSRSNYYSVIQYYKCDACCVHKRIDSLCVFFYGADRCETNIWCSQNKDIRFITSRDRALRAGGSSEELLSQRLVKISICVCYRSKACVLLPCYYLMSLCFDSQTENALKKPAGTSVFSKQKSRPRYYSLS